MHHKTIRRKKRKTIKIAPSKRPVVIFSAKAHFSRLQRSLSKITLSSIAHPKDFTKQQSLKDHINIIKPIGHSFLFWLAVPLVILWLTAGYLIGFIKENPSWLGESYSYNANVQVSPYVQKYPSINTENSEGFVTFWFDDAWLSDYMNAYPILRRYSFPAAIAVPVNFVEQRNYVNWAQLRKLQTNGWEITNHSLNHDCTINKWSKKTIEDEMKESINILWKNHLSSDIFVPPCGVDSPILREAAGEKFLAYRTVDPGFNDLNNIGKFNLKVKNIDKNIGVAEIKSWIDYTKNNRYWVILVLHKVGEENGNTDEEKYNISISDFSEIVNYIRMSNLSVIVPSQIL